LDQDELEKSIENLMRVTANHLERKHNKEISLSELSTVNVIKNAKGFTYDHKIPLSKIFTVCYPSLFHHYVTEKNQTIIGLIEHPPAGPLGTCPPEQVPEPRVDKTKMDAQTAY